MVQKNSSNIFQRFSRLRTLTTSLYLWVSGIARLPVAMTNLGILTLVASVTGSYTDGGIAVAATGLANAIGGPIVGAIADKHGQRKVMNVTVVVNLIALGWLLYNAFNYPEQPVGWMIAAAALAGLSTPQVAGLARARWMAITHIANPNDPPKQRRELDTALSFESTIDELGFAFGPALVGLIAGIFNPALAIVFSGILILSFTSVFANHPIANQVHEFQKSSRTTKTESSVQVSETDGRWWTQIVFPVSGMVGQGAFFGATGVTTLAYASNQGLGDSGGLLYGAMGLVSGITALSVASWPANFTNRSRWLYAALLMCGLTWWWYTQYDAPLWLMLIILLLVGIPVGPALVTTFSTVSEYVPAHRLATAMTITQAALVLGTSIGNSLGGILVESHGEQGGFLLAALAATVITIAAIANYIQKWRLRHGRLPLPL